MWRTTGALNPYRPPPSAPPNNDTKYAKQVQVRNKAGVSHVLMEHVWKKAQGFSHVAMFVIQPPPSAVLSCGPAHLPCSGYTHATPLNLGPPTTRAITLKP